MKDMNDMDTLLIDFHIHTVYSQEICAHLSIKDTLDYYQKLGARAGQKVIIRVNDHDNFYGGVKAVEYFLEHRADYPNIFVVPGIEFNTNLGSALKFKKDDYVANSNYPDEDDKYNFIFKKAHVGAAPILLKDLAGFEKWKNNKDLQVYSKLAKMFLDRTKDEQYRFESMAVALSHDQRKQLSNTGDQVIASKNLIRKKFGIIIPYSYLEPCVKEGQTHLEILNTFLNLATDYVKNNYAPYRNLSFDNVKIRLKKLLEAEDCIDFRIVMTTNEAISNARRVIENEFDINISDESIKACFDDKLSRQEKIELFHQTVARQLVGHPKCEGANQNKICLRLKHLTFGQFADDRANKFYSFGGLRRIHFDEMCKMVYEAGGLIDMEHPSIGFEIHQDKTVPIEILRKLDYSVLRVNDQKIVQQKLAQNRDLKLTDLLGENCNNDRTGLIRIQLLRYGMKQNGIQLNNDMMGVELTKYSLKNTRHLNSIFGVMERNKFLPSYGSDKHLNVIDYYAFAAKDKEYRKDYKGNMRVIDERYLRNLYQSIKKEKELASEFEKYTLPTQVVHTACVYDRNYDTTIKEKVYSDLVKQTAFCDAVLGNKVVDYTNSNTHLFSMKLGALVNDDDFSNVEHSKFDEIMKIIYLDIYQTQVKMGKDNFTKEQLAEIREYSRNEVLEYKDQHLDATERELSEFLVKTLSANRVKMKEYHDVNELNR